jgi:uncharacterized membrane protein YbhN (UPF0104 family)
MASSPAAVATGTTDDERPAPVEGGARRDLKGLLGHLRVTPWSVGISLATVVLLVVGVLWASHLPAELSQGDVDWTWVVAAAAVVVGVYVGWSISLAGATSQHLPPLRLLQLEVSESLTQMATPDGIGSYALSMRFLTRNGLEGPAAAAACGLNGFVTSGVSALLVPIGAVVAASTLDLTQLRGDAPSGWWTVILAVVVVALVVTLVRRLPRAKQTSRRWLREGGQYIHSLLRHPGRGLVIAGGELVAAASQTACMCLLLVATGAPVNVAAVMVIVLLATAASNTVPVPGGLGAPEAILMAGLTSIGVHHTDAMIASLTYRMFTYWVPPVPGTLLLYDLFRRNLV